MPDICLTQRQVHTANKFLTSNYQSIEYGTVRPSHDSIIKLADFFEVSTDYLLVLTNNPTR